MPEKYLYSEKLMGNIDSLHFRILYAYRTKKKKVYGTREENFKAIGFMCIVLPLFGLFDHR